MSLATATAPGRPGARLDLLLAAACAAAAFLVHLPTIRGEFLLTWDDGEYVVFNEAIRSLGSGTLAWAFTDLSAHSWMPLAKLSFALDHRLWGLDPVGFHLTNVLLHAANAGLWYAVARRLLATPAASLDGRTRRAAALLASLAWALHPLRVESVAWVSERKDVLSTLFGLAAVLAYLGHVRCGAPFRRSPRYAAAVALYALSLLAKPALVTLPVLLAILDAYPLRRPGRGRSPPELAEKVPLLGLAAISIALTLAAHGDGAVMPLSEAGVVSRTLVALRAMFEYVRMSAWPVGLSPFYLHPGQVSAGDPAYLVPALLVLAATAAAVGYARRHPAPAAAWLCFLVAVAPGLGSTQVSDTALADRFTYVAAMPLTLLASAAVAAGLARLAPRRAAACAAGLGVLVALLAALSVRQGTVWRDDVALWSRPIDLDPRRSGRVYSQRATAREARGDFSGARADMDAAIAIATSKGYAFMDALHARRARIHVALGALAEAIADYDRALETASSHDATLLLRERAAAYRAAGDDARAADDERLAERMAERIAGGP